MENLSTRITYIYGLYEVGKEDDIRYVGKSDNPKNRLFSHKSSSLRCVDKTHKSCWIRSVYKRGGKIDILIIEEVSYDKWSEREIYWISKYDNLTNLSPGGETGITGKLFNIEYIECKKWVNENYPNLKSIKDYRDIKLPNFIPKSPHTVFKNYGWVSWQEFLGYDFETSKNKNKKYLSYDECKKWIKENYTSIEKWDVISKKLPDFIPKRPYTVYKNSGWKGWLDFIGVDLSPKKYISYEMAKEYVHKLKINSLVEWFEYWKNNKKNKDFPSIPKSPNSVYKNKWEGWTTFLNSSNKSYDINLNKMKYEDLVIYVRENLSHIKTSRQWKKYIKENNFDNIPINPEVSYKDKWESWNIFLENGNERQKDFYDYETCKKIIKENNIKTNKEWRIWVNNIKGIPKSPEHFFKNEWISWYDFLGK